jgi:hypothetical protein
MKRRTFKKRLSRLMRDDRWQYVYIVGHHLRWSLLSTGKFMVGRWRVRDPRTVTEERLNVKYGFNKQQERNRLAMFWGLKRRKNLT